jgi:type IV pilus assembly protein PilM
MMPSLPKIVSQSAVVGLDIGTRVIKAVEMRSGRQGIEILNIGIQPTPLDSIAGGMVMDARSLGAAVRQCLDAAGIKTRRVISSVSGQTSLVVRPIEVPRMSRSELAETMKWEVERHIPFVASEVIMDYQPLIDPEDIPEEQTTMEVLLAVAQEDLINAHLETLRLAKLEPIAIDVEPLAATRATVDMEADQGTYDTTIALVNVGATTTDVSIIRNGLLSMARPVPVAGDNLTRAIAEALGVEEEEAERLKQEHGRVMLDAVAAVAAPPAPVVTEAPPVAAPTVVAPAPRPEDESRVAPAFDLSAELEEERPSRPVYEIEEEPAPAPAPAPAPSPVAPTVALPEPVSMEGGDLEERVFRAMLPILSELVLEIRRTIEYHRSRSPESSVSRVVLYGGTARLENLERFLSNEIGIPVERADPLRLIDTSHQPNDPEYLASVSCLLPIAIGLAIRNMLE